MEICKTRTEQFLEIGLDLEEWQRLYYKNQQDYIRKRLIAIKYLYTGYSRLQVCQFIDCSYNTLASWIDKFIEGGLERLVEPIKHKNAPQHLSQENKQELRKIILEQSPKEHGIDRNFWTGEIIAQIIQHKWNISLKDSRIYEILKELKVTYQKAHRDYANANKAEQGEFVGAKKKIESLRPGGRVFFFDEFAVYDRPSLFYGWAAVNSRPQVLSDERRKRNKLNGFLSVDAVSGEEYFILSERSKTEDVVSYLALLCDDMAQEGCDKITIILDRNPTHKDKMRCQLKQLFENLGLTDRIEVEFIHTPAYSPDFNLAEYLIHQFRLKILHHLPADTTIDDIQMHIETYFANHQLQTPEQIKNTINHICKLGRQS
ncbi:IS630 family transposase [Microcoleus sp. N3A4]|uniref:IS630 family transposase n=1 Tax=Microcoleus sp. N3A4 TaxID=3055379 RepID=UPI002FD60F66